MATRVVVGCDSIAFSIGIKDILSQDKALTVVAIARSITQTLLFDSELIPDVTVIGMVNFNSEVQETLQRMSSQFHTGFVMLINPRDWAAISPMLELQTTVCVSTIDTEEEIRRAVNHAAKGYSYVSPNLQLHSKGWYHNQHAGLSSREREILAFVAVGYTSAEIADHLGISPRTVETHRRRISQKLGIKSRAQMVQYAKNYGMTD